MNDKSKEEIQVLEELREYKELDDKLQMECGTSIKELCEKWNVMLAEYLQYQELGTVEELRTMKENGSFTGVELAQLAAMQMKLKEYQSIGTIEQIRERCATLEDAIKYAKK